MKVYELQSASCFGAEEFGANKLGAKQGNVDLAGAFKAVAKVAASKLHTWSSNMRTRKQLAALDTQYLEDIGVTRAQADAESRKPFWQ